MDEPKNMRQKMKEEKEKLSAMSWGQRVEYIWDYYKPLLAALLGLILLIYFGTEVYHNLNRKGVFYAYFLNCDNTKLDVEMVADEFAESIGGLKKNEFIDIDASLILGQSGDGQYNMASQTKLVAVAGSGMVDVLLIPEEIYQEYQEADSLLPLDEILSDEQKKEWKELLVYDLIPEGDGEAVYALEIEKAPYIQKHGIYSGDRKIYGVVYNGSHNTELCDDFFDFLLR